MSNIKTQLDRIASSERRRNFLGIFLVVAAIPVFGFLFFGGLTATSSLSYQSAVLVRVVVSEAKNHAVAALEVELDGKRLAVVGPRQLAMLRAGDSVCLRKEETIFGTHRYFATTDVFCPGITR